MIGPQEKPIAIKKKGSWFGNWIWWKQNLRRLIITFSWLFLFWIIVSATNLGLNKYTENKAVNELSAKVKSLQAVVVELNESTDNMILGSIMKLQPKLDKEVAEKISEAIITNCIKKELSPYLVICLMFVESGFNQMATSNKMAIGLMQVHWKSWNGSEICDGIETINGLYQIETNIDCGTSILKKLITEGGSIRKGLNSYYGVASPEYHKKMANALYTIMF